MDILDEWISIRIGIKERRFVKEFEVIFDLVFKVVLKVIECVKLNVEDIELIILVIIIFDMFLFLIVCIV